MSGQLHALATLALRKILQDSMVSIMSRLWAEQFRFQILRRAGDFSLIEIMQIGLDVHPSSYFVGTRIFLPKDVHHHMALKLRMSRVPIFCSLCMPSWHGQAQLHLSPIT